MIRNLLSAIVFIFFLSISASAQEDSSYYSSAIGSGGFAFGFKGGPTIATQTWNGFQRNALFSYHGDAFVEVMGSWKAKGSISQRSSFLASLGYHRKGSTFRNVFFYNQNNQKVTIPSNLFHNISLGLLGKGAFKFQEKSLAYYGIGLTLDYTITYQLVGVGSSTGVNRFTYGIWFGGGYEWNLGKSPWAFFVEANINPDIGRQVFIPPGLPTQYRDPITDDVIKTQQQKVNNLILEISVGFKINK
jgi:hypothetical protein